MDYEDILQETSGPNRGQPAQTKTEGSGHLAVRVNESNLNHHLWNNRGTWWCHFTLHKDDYTAERVRVSLKTADVEIARARRDELLAAVSS